jgi:hypothetical protein
LIDFKETAHSLGDFSERSARRLIAGGELPQPARVLSASRLCHSKGKAYLERLKNKRPSRQRQGLCASGGDLFQGKDCIDREP